MDQSTRDRLLAHARQDASHALLNTTTLLQQMASMRRVLWLITGLLVICTIMLASRL
jgi:hypothetical protein